ncbi:MAG: metallophosphoesterase family protein [Promethearchaeota archaeon]
MIWFSADFHLSHKNIIRYCNRPFSSVEEMDTILIRNLEERLRPKDILYFLGDLTFKEPVARNFFKRFSAVEIHYIIGNHDSGDVIKLAEKYCVTVSNLKEINVENHHIILCHYAMRVWNRSHYNSWQLFGHSHTKLEPVGKQYDVGVDNNSFYPVSIKRLEQIMESQQNNPI